MLRELEQAHPEQTFEDNKDYSKKQQKTGHKTVAEVFGDLLGSTRSTSGFVGREKEDAAKDADIQAQLSQAQQEKAKTEAKRRRMDESRMKTAVSFNAVVREHSKSAGLVVMNLPLMRSVEHESDFCGYVETITENIENCLMIRGSGQEVVTTFG